MPVDDLPILPTFPALESWAGAGRVIRATTPTVAAWRLPESQKAALVSSGIPLIDGLVDEVSFRTEPARYQLAERHPDECDASWAYAVVPGTEQVLETSTSSSSTRLVNSTISHWLCSLHLVGKWLATSTAVQHWDEDEQAEETALDELAYLSGQIRALDPRAYGTGDHRTHFWPAVLDRWLY